MPELPDLQVFSHNLQKKLKGKTVVAVKVQHTAKLKVAVAALQHGLEKHKINEVYREGKELRFKFTGGSVWGMHLMLHGRLELFAGETLPRHTIAALLFDDGTGLALTDYQGAANISLDPEESKVPDALSKEMSIAYLTEKLGKTRAAIKNVLLDQKVIRGIGDAYADEILWAARIAPLSPANKVPEEKIKDLHNAITHILKDAEKQITLADPDIIAGEVRDFLSIHNSKKKQSPTGAAIKIDTTSARKTYYTDEQILYK